MRNLPEYFGEMVFGDSVMRARLPRETYDAIKRTIDEGRALDKSVANVVANAMKDWAIEKGATHYTHWFQPLNGVTAEKHDSFMSPVGDGKVIMEFSGKELIKGESDASSFPSGGLRATFEARGYTAWDPTAYAFIKDRTLCIPTAFCSFGGEALDKKTPLLRSMEAVNKQTMRVLRLFGNDDVKAVKTTVGAEQEYFLVDKEMYDKRKDLVYTGRTLFGSRPPKGQELDDHYFGAIKQRVAEYMTELDEELWRLGIYAKTEHNEAAPAQHELAPVFTTTNIATDQNQLTMEVMQKVAKKHGLVCLLHEKPFKGVNGSGKHNNWSISTSTGVNLLTPGETPGENAQFLLFLCAVIEAVDNYQDLLRISIATPGNDHRLGAGEAPPAIVSMFLGDEITAVLDAIENGTAYSAAEKTQLRLGVHTLPKFPRDTTDRNRTSPFAFTGNKFEFRMLGSKDSIADCNTVLNTAVAESLKRYADVLESAEDFSTSLHDLIRSVVREHRRIIFNGNGYNEAWIEEAEKRGLMNLRTTPECIPYLVSEKNVRLFSEHKVFTETELRSRCEIMLENYCKVIAIEADTALEMARRELIPAIVKYSEALTNEALAKRQLIDGVDIAYELGTVKKLSECVSVMYSSCEELYATLKGLKKCGKEAATLAIEYKDRVIPLMEKLRAAADTAEINTAKKYWPIPSYGDLLFGVR